VNIPPLCIVQARYHSTRLPGKMLLRLGRETIIERGYRIACKAFGSENVVVAIPRSDVDGPLGDELRRIGAPIEAPNVDERDVLARFWYVAHAHRWHPDSIIFRWTPDDFLKTPASCRSVAEGYRYPVEVGGEAFTLAQLDHAQKMTTDLEDREHIGTNPDLFVFSAPRCPDGCWTIDTLEQYEQARRIVVGNMLVTSYGIIEDTIPDEPPGREIE
jgi:spore coat polysaccharide biosynthesis protein SpsF (cytidylyltransferase family)